ncbi:MULTISPECIES: IncP plasmid survival protein KfrC family protein [Pseudomonadota]|uniref:KfrC n=13 Tax=Pseudomonadota TaxID=1224 RepID=G9C9H8_COMTE|nr:MULTISPECIES: IncP plasmid survival protein KfrC family protein [Pseudomonadota]AEV57178.1 KfrC [uncultured bacterium]AEV91107.1 KfrC [synthetic construct]MCB2029023.1 conjugal transfer protein [Rhodoferax sp.]ABM06184.1 conjugal transfer protein [Comamonas testosteroni CNB-1]ADP19894.1 conjugal transfer protein [Achromobacter xylosoxidans A8]
MRRLTPTAGRADARRIQPASAGFATSTTSRTDAAGDGLLAAAEATEAEQQAALEAAPLDQTYQEALALYVQAKHDQVERIEDRLENLIDRQQARLQQTQANQPGLLSRPGAKRAWQNQQMQQQARLQSLHVRLEAVREIKEGMGLHSPKVEELATRKMRAEKPELAADWDAMREAARRHQALQRREEQERKQAQALERPGRSQSLGLTRPV